VCCAQTAEGAGRVDVASVRFGVCWLALVTTCLHAAVCLDWSPVVTDMLGKAPKACKTSQSVWNCLGKTGISRTYTVQPSCRSLENKLFSVGIWLKLISEWSGSVLCTLWFLIAVSSRKTLHQYTDRSLIHQPVWHTNYSSKNLTKASVSAK